jgi:hypothetical protein
MSQAAGHASLLSRIRLPGADVIAALWLAPVGSLQKKVHSYAGLPHRTDSSDKPLISVPVAVIATTEALLFYPAVPRPTVIEGEPLLRLAAETWSARTAPHGLTPRLFITFGGVEIGLEGKSLFFGPNRRTLPGMRALVAAGGTP